MFYGFAPTLPGFYTGGIKANGVNSNGAVVVGPVLGIDTPVNNKQNRTVTSFGDLNFAPTVWALVYDPDLLDSSMNHTGYW